MQPMLVCVVPLQHPVVGMERFQPWVAASCIHNFANIIAVEHYRLL